MTDFPPQGEQPEDTPSQGEQPEDTPSQGEQPDNTLPQGGQPDDTNPNWGTPSYEAPYTPPPGYTPAPPPYPIPPASGQSYPAQPTPPVPPEQPYSTQPTPPVPPEQPYSTQPTPAVPPEQSYPTQPVQPVQPEQSYPGQSYPEQSYTTPGQPYPTQDWGAPSWGAPAAPAGAAGSAGAGRRDRRGLGFAASVVAAALIVGGGAGIGTAAIYHHADNSSGSTQINVASNTTAGTNASAPAGSVEKVAADVLPSVVKIEVEGSQEAGSGSGIILNTAGDILTNNHVVAVAGTSGKIRVDFNDGSTAPATIVGTDPTTDTAVIKVSGVSGLTAATIGNSSSVLVGQSVVAIGSPFGLDSTVTSGIVSALNRPVNVSQDTSTTVVYPAIQTDAAINPGNSGGPLVNLNGQVIGINASIQSTSSGSGDGSSDAGSIGLGFAIPIDEVMPVIQQMLNGQTPTHARIGVTVSNVPAQGADQEDDLFVPNGAEVTGVNSGSAAASAGLKAGDIITKVDNQLITDSDSLVATIRSYRPGDTVTITWSRNGKTMSASVKLDSDASSSPTS